MTVNLSICFLYARNTDVIFAEKPQMKINSLNKQKHANLINSQTF